jgi:hypothetical protein
MPLIKATRIEDVYRAFDPSPLDTPDELQTFYVDELNRIRGSDRIETLALGLRRQHGRGFYKAFVMGHSGVGISTELTRLQTRVSDRFRVLRLSATLDFDRVNFKVFDIPLRIALGLADETAKSVQDGGAGSEVPDELIRRILQWFRTEEITLKDGTEKSGGAGVELGSGPLLEKFLSFKTSLKGEIKFSSGREKKVIEYRQKNVGQLAQLANDIIDDCNRRLRQATGCEWLVIGDDFDKPGVPRETIEAAFIENGDMLGNLHCHLVIDIPVSLGHSSRANQLPPQFEGPHNFPDTPVYQKDHTEHKKGRAALRSVIAHRMDADLFARGQELRLIVASGGNLRDLFSLIVDAATHAELRAQPKPPAKITKADCDAAINNLRKEYRDHLGSTDFDIEKADLKAKLDKLTDIYLGKPEAEVRDATLYSLLHAKAVQEFNGISWFGVHPLIVDFLDRLEGRAELDTCRDVKTKRLPGGSID